MYEFLMTAGAIFVSQAALWILMVGFVFNERFLRWLAKKSCKTTKYLMEEMVEMEQEES